MNQNNRTLSLERFLEIKNSFPREFKLKNFKEFHEERLANERTLFKSYEEMIPHTRKTLEIVLKDTPKQFQDFVCRSMYDWTPQPFYKLKDMEIMLAAAAYEDYHSLHAMFDALYDLIERERSGKIINNAEFVPFPTWGSANRFAIRHIKKKNGQIETKLVRDDTFGEIFLNINWKQMKRCVRCDNYFYAAKDDERIKYCSSQCSNAERQTNFQERRNKK